MGDKGEGGVKNLKKMGDVICERPLFVILESCIYVGLYV